MKRSIQGPFHGGHLGTNDAADTVNPTPFMVGGLVVVHLGPGVEWLGLEPDQAREMARRLMRLSIRQARLERKE